VTVHFTSYAGCTGVYNPEPWLYPKDPFNQDRIRQMNGLFITQSSIAMTDIQDGTSQTLLLSERAHGLLTGNNLIYWHWWADCTAVDTRFWTMFPINPWRKMSDTPGDQAGSPYTSSASSFHRNGANFAFADGSVKFLKETIDSWAIDDARGLPIGVSVDDNGFLHFTPKVSYGVLVSADSY
jgi:prepilin-type processing-associated H-X9-DG protein